MDRWPRQTVRAVFRASAWIVGVAVLGGYPSHGHGKPLKPGSDSIPEGAFSVGEKSSPVYADPFPSPPAAPSADLLLSTRGQTRAESLACFAAAAVAEEQDGPARALSLYQSALALDPANTSLALRLASEMLADEKPTEALRLLKDAHTFAPEHPGPLLELARIYLTVLRRPDGALTYAEKAYKLAPDSIPVLSAYLDTCSSAQLVQKIEDALKRVLVAPNPNPEFWIQTGTLFRNALALRNQAQRPAMARVHDLFKKALALAPSNPAVIEAVSDHYALTQQTSEASVLYQRAVLEYRKQNGTSPAGICIKWARALIIADQVSPAMQLLEELLSEQPGTTDARELLGELHLQQGQIVPALMQFRLALDGESSRPDDFIRVAQLELRIKRAADAVATARRGRNLFPDSAQLTMLAAIALAETKEHAESLRCFEEAERLFSITQKSALDAPFYLTFGAAAERAGLPEQAARLLQKSIDIDPENAAEALNYLGFMWVDRSENLDQAGDLIRRALQLRPETPAYLDSLGWWHYRKGQFEAALKEIRKALERTTREDSSEIYDHLGDVLDKLNRKEEALEAWKKAHELNPELPGVSNKIKKAEDNR